METKTQADKLFDSYLKFQHIEEDTFDEILKCLDIDPDEPNDWPFNDFSHDQYDYSFELDRVELEWEPTQEQIERCWELGFHRCWLNYVDGTEKYYYKKSNEN